MQDFPGAVAVLASSQQGEENREVVHILPDDRPAAGNEAARENLLAALKAIRTERFSLDHREYALIQGALALGADWKHIAEALGLGTQEAAQQYAALEARIGP